MFPLTVVQILDNNLQVVTVIRSFYPLNQDGMILSYSKELSDYGTCNFRVSTKDPLFEQFGDILVPHQYHIRVVREGITIWSGGIIDNPDRNSVYVTVKAAEYDFYLSKMLIRRDANVTPGDGKENYRTIDSGTMADVVTGLLTDAIADFAANSPMQGFSVGIIDNPQYPLGFQDANGNPLAGDWVFTDFISLQFDYMSVLYVLQALGTYSSCDFVINSDLSFDFRNFVGNKSTGLTFTYGRQGNVVDYSSPRLGEQMSNDIWGIAADNSGNVLHVEQTDSVSIDTYGLLQTAQAFTDVKDSNFLKQRVNASLTLVKDPNISSLSVILNEKGYPLGRYGIGDIVTIVINDNVIQFNQPMRIVGITVNLQETGREMTTLQLNRPDPTDLVGV